MESGLTNPLALIGTGAAKGVTSPELLQAVEAVYQFQKQRLHDLISSHFGGAKSLAGRRFALWGLAYGLRPTSSTSPTPTTCA